MKDLTCYIVDDEFRAINLLARFIENTPGIVLSGSAENPLEAIPAIMNNTPPDITFADINMPQLSGTDLYGMIGMRTKVIFTTGFAGYAAAAFDLQATDFLLKPFSYDRFLQAVNRVKTLKPPVLPHDFFFIKCETKGKMIRVNFTDVTYFQAAQNYIIVHLKDGKHMTYLTMKELEESLPEGRFLRIHKSFIINLDKIRSVEGGAVILTDGTLVLIGGMYREQLQQQLAGWTIMSKRLLK